MGPTCACSRAPSSTSGARHSTRRSTTRPCTLRPRTSRRQSTPRRSGWRIRRGVFDRALHVCVTEAESMATVYPAARNLCAAVTYTRSRICDLPSKDIKNEEEEEEEDCTGLTRQG